MSSDAKIPKWMPSFPTFMGVAMPLLFLGIATGNSFLSNGGWLLVAFGVPMMGLVLPVPWRRPYQRALTGLGYVFFFIPFGVAVMMVPGASAWSFSRFVVDRIPTVLQVIIMILWIAGLCLIAALLYLRSLRGSLSAWLGSERAPRWLRVGPLKMPGWGALLLYMNLVFFAMGGFSGVALLLHRNQRCSEAEAAQQCVPMFVPGSRPSVDHGSLGDFFLWQFLNGIPALEVTKTIQWKEPLAIGNARAGWLVLLFKILVIIPIVWGFGRYLKAEEPASSLAGPPNATAPPAHASVS